MAVDPHRAQALFMAALELSDRAARKELLDRECAGDEELQRRVDALLGAHEAAGGFGGEPSGAAMAATVNLPGDIRPAALIAGRYKLIEVIGEGGMGAVWLAEQKEPVKRRVAVKLVKPGMDSRAVLARFEAERQALAMMDHPNIARVLDGGMTEHGRPFFAMELVRGVAVTEYCDQAQLSIRERLALFGQICAAVQHAHQKGIIHRDLKPTNILVTEHDGRPLVKVIDFGLAKALHGAHTLTDLSLHTSFGAVLGTPLYMAPEQLGASALDVDTRADLYSLGVILYELLTGSTPIERDRLKDAVWDEVRRIVRDEEPPRPSTRLSSSGSLASLAARRHVEPARLARMVRGELDWIIMKSLEKDRNRRYETAGSLGQDVQRYLDGEPVQAAPPSRLYRARKLARRHRGPVLAASLIVLALVAGLTGTMYGLVRANESAEEARDKQAIAERAQRAAEDAAARERAATQQTKKRLAQIDKGLEVFSEMLIDIDPRAVEQGGEPLIVQLRKRAEQAADELDAEAVGDPLAEARLLTVLGKTLQGLGGFEKAREVLERAHRIRNRELGAEHADTLATLQVLAAVHREAGRNHEAIQLFERIRDARVYHPAAGDFDFRDTLNSLAVAYLAVGEIKKASEIFEQVGNEYASELGEDNPLTLNMRHNLADAYDAAGNTNQAIELLERVRVAQVETMGADHPLTLGTLNGLACMYQDVGRLDEGIELLAQVFDARQRKLGPQHADTLVTLNNLGSAYRRARRVPEAIATLEQARDGLLKEVGAEHGHTLAALHNLAMAYRDAGRVADAIALLESIRDTESRTLGPESVDALTTLNSLAATYRVADRLAEAIAIFEQVRDRRVKKLGADHPDTLSTLHGLAAAYLSDGRVADAIRIFEPLRRAVVRKLGADHDAALGVLNGLADAYLADGRHDEAIAILEQLRETNERMRGAEHPATLNAINNLAYAYRDAGQPELAVSLFEGAFKTSKETAGIDDPGTIQFMNNLAATYWSLRRLDQSIPLFEEALRLREQKLGRQHRETLNTLGNLGVNYRDAGKLDAAISALEEACAASERHPQLQFFRGELLQAYATAGQPSEKAKQLAKDMLSDARKELPRNSPQLAASLASFGSFLLQFQAHADAEPLLRECLEIREEAIPDSWLTFNARSMLGESLLRQGKYSEAEPPLLTGYAGMKDRQRMIPEESRIRLTEALTRLVDLYTAMDKPDDARKWQAELEQHQGDNTQWK